jgi:hypothetical protein
VRLLLGHRRILHPVPPSSPSVTELEIGSEPDPQEIAADKMPIRSTVRRNLARLTR